MEAGIMTSINFAKLKSATGKKCLGFAPEEPTHRDMYFIFPNQMACAIVQTCVRFLPA
jgi:hypothetical protein